MAKKKYYAVRKGLTTGIFESWTECQAATTGYSNAEFMSFSNMKEAQDYIDNGDINLASLNEQKSETFDIPAKKLQKVELT